MWQSLKEMQEINAAEMQGSRKLQSETGRKDVVVGGCTRELKNNATGVTGTLLNTAVLFVVAREGK